MKIYDINGNLITDPDLSLGRLISDKRFVARYPAVESVLEQSHYEIVAEYPNGGKDIQKIIDVPAVTAQEARDEYEDIYRYIPYTDEELAAIEVERNKPTTEDRLSELEAALDMLLSGVTE